MLYPHFEKTVAGNPSQRLLYAGYTIVTIMSVVVFTSLKSFLSSLKIDNSWNNYFEMFKVDQSSFQKTDCMYKQVKEAIQSVEFYSPVPLLWLFLAVFRGSHPEVFLGKGVLKICSKVIGEHLCWSTIDLLWLLGWKDFVYQTQSPRLSPLLEILKPQYSLQ